MKTELHAHTSESSPCSHVDAVQMIKMYKNCGYDAVVITDHYSKWTMEKSKSADKTSYEKYFFKGYERASKYAKKIGFTVLLGAEISLLESPNDYLLYGADMDFFHKNPLLFSLTLKKLYSLCVKNNILLVQAHPCRAYCTPSDAKLLDGAEVYNANMRHNNNNNEAFKWAENNNLIMVSGSDFHEKEDLALGGIITDTDFSNMTELINILRSGKYTLIN